MGNARGPWFILSFDVLLFNIVGGGRTPKQGAATSINCAVNPQLNSQQCLYYDSCRPTSSSADSRYNNTVETS